MTKRTKKAIKEDWRTTVSGLVAAAPQILGVLGVAIPEPISKVLLGLGILSAAFFATENRGKQEKPL